MSTSLTQATFLRLKIAVMCDVHVVEDWTKSGSPIQQSVHSTDIRWQPIVTPRDRSTALLRQIRPSRTAQADIHSPFGR